MTSHASGEGTVPEGVTYGIEEVDIPPEVPPVAEPEPPTTSPAAAATTPAGYLGGGGGESVATAAAAANVVPETLGSDQAMMAGNPPSVLPNQTANIMR